MGEGVGALGVGGWRRLVKGGMNAPHLLIQRVYKALVSYPCYSIHLLTWPPDSYDVVLKE